MFASAFSVLTRTWSKSMLTVWSDLNSPIFMLSFIRRSLSLGLVWILTHCQAKRHCITVFSFFIRLWYDSDLNGEFVEWGGLWWSGWKSETGSPLCVCGLPVFLVCSAWAYSNGCKSLTSPNSGNCIANSKGVHCEVESERSRRQTSDLTYRNFI